MSLAPQVDPASKEPGPIRVVRVDVDGVLPEVSPFRDDGSLYVGAWVIVLRSGVPVGHVELPLAGRVVSAAELRGVLSGALGDVFSPGPVVGVVADSGLPVVSVVVPSTFDRVALLERCVASLVAQDYPAFEVIVVDNRPEATDARAGFWARLCADSRVSVVGEARPGISAARNCGVASAVGEVVAFIDDDVEVESGWLRAIGSRFAVESETDCVTGLVLPMELETPAQIWFERSGGHMDQAYKPISFGNDGAWRGRFLSGLRRGRFEVTAHRDGELDETFLIYRAGKIGAGASLAVRIEALRSVGGFDEALGTGTRAMAGEDHMLLVMLLLAQRRITFDPAAFVFHTHRRTFEELKTQLHGYGNGYTAMLTAAGCRSRAHVMGLTWYFLQAVFLLPRKFLARKPAHSGPVGPEFPRELSGAEFRGLVNGPWTYFVSKRAVRRLGSRDQGRPAARVEAAVAASSGRAREL